MDRLFFLGTFLLLIYYEVFPYPIAFKALPILLFLMVVGAGILEKKRVWLQPFRLLFILALMVAFGLARSNREDATLLNQLFKIISFLIFFFAYCTILYKYKVVLRKNLLYAFLKLVYLPIIVFVGLNLVLFFIGFYGKIDDSIETRTAVILSYFGIAMERVRFPLVVGVNAYAALVGTLFAISIVGLGVINRYKMWFISGLVISGISLLLTDSRGPILYSILIFLLIKFIYSKTVNPRFLKLIPLIGFVGPIIWMFISFFLSQTDYADTFSRSSADLATGNGRFIIWGMALNEFMVFKPEHHIFGYGEFGQYAAGLSQQWGPLIFGNAENAEYVHPHNTLLSIALDYGYAGILLFMVIQYAIVKIIKEIWNTYRHIAYLLLANILYFNLVGIGETMFGFYYQNILYLFFMINIFAFFVRYINNSNKTILRNV